MVVVECGKLVDEFVYVVVIGVDDVEWGVFVFSEDGYGGEFMCDYFYDFGGKWVDEDYVVLVCFVDVVEE